VRARANLLPISCFVQASAERASIGHQYLRKYVPSALKGHALEKLEPGFTINVTPHDVRQLGTPGHRAGYRPFSSSMGSHRAMIMHGAAIKLKVKT
jgi:hypothetical protein